MLDTEFNRISVYRLDVLSRGQLAVLTICEGNRCPAQSICDLLTVLFRRLSPLTVTGVQYVSFADVSVMPQIALTMHSDGTQALRQPGEWLAEPISSSSVC